MPYITSKLASPVTYAFYTRGANKINTVTEEITINGGADVINKKTLETPSGVVTELTEKQLERLKSHPVFKNHYQNGYITILSTEKEANKADKNLQADNSKQKTPKDYERQNKKKPTTKA